MKYSIFYLFFTCVIFILTGCTSKNTQEISSDKEIDVETIEANNFKDEYNQGSSNIDLDIDSIAYSKSEKFIMVMLDIIQKKERIENFKTFASHVFKEINVNDLSVIDKCNFQIFCFYFVDEIARLKDSENDNDQTEYRNLTNLFESDFSNIFIQNMEALQSDLNDNISKRMAEIYLEELQGEAGRLAHENLAYFIDTKKGRTENIQSQPIRSTVMQKLYYKNEIKAKQTYPMGREYIVSVRVYRVVEDNSRGFRYRVDSEVACLFSNDPMFVEIQYPIDIIVKGKLTAISYTDDLIFTNVSLIDCLGYDEYDNSNI